jgi:predicted regulator of Ras-like GTPase activity (Roadblock/LC7/MglB family)
MHGAVPSAVDLLGEALATLRDVDGVRGSFLVSPDGRVLARDLPSVVDARSLSDASLRVARLVEALATDGDDPDTLSLRFAEHRLHVRVVHGGLLAILSDVRVNLPTLKMAVTLVARRFGSLERLPMPDVDAVPPSFAATAATMTPIPPTLASPRSAPDAEPSSKRQVMYRGRRIS